MLQQSLQAGIILWGNMMELGGAGKVRALWRSFPEQDWECELACWLWFQSQWEAFHIFPPPPRIAHIPRYKLPRIQQLQIYPFGFLSTNEYFDQANNLERSIVLTYCSLKC